VEETSNICTRFMTELRDAMVNVVR
jgi:hypothetical protein